MSTEQTKLSICADDYGITDKVSEAIISLISIGRISETSCMVTRPNIKNDINSLLIHKNKINIGLHLTLTDFNSLSSFNKDKKLPSYKNLFFSTLKRKISKNLINDEINSQLDKFENIFGFAPNFIDGHHHVHQLPVINNCLINIIKDRYKDNSYWVRNSAENFLKLIKRKTNFLKAFALSSYGNKFKKILENNNIKTNDGFSGIYNFSDQTNYEELFLSFLNNINNNHLLMVHPGYSDDKLKNLDSVTHTRNLEYNFLSSDIFLKILHDKKIKLNPLFKI